MIQFDTLNKATPLLRSRNYVNLSTTEPEDEQTCLRFDSSPFSYHPPADSHLDLSGLFEPEENESEAEAYHYVADFDPTSPSEPAGANQAQAAPLPESSVQVDPVSRLDEDDRHKVAILRQLLENERESNQRRRRNNAILQDHLAKLQAEYLELQRDLIQTLEMAHKIKEQKSAQLESTNELVREKDIIIQRLRETMDNLDESKVRQEFEVSMSKQKQLLNLQQQQLQDQITTLSSQLEIEQAKSSSLIIVHRKELDEARAKYEEEVGRLTNKCQQIQQDYDRVLEEPKNSIIKSLREDKCHLENQIDELNSIIHQGQLKYDSIKSRMQDLMDEFETVKRESEEEVEKSLELQLRQRQTINQLEMELEDKDEVIQIVQFNLQRSEKRVKNLLSALKNKESTYEELIHDLQMKYEEELEKSVVQKRLLERKAIDLDDEVNKKQNEIVRLELEHANQIDSLKNDRDQRVQKLTSEKQKLERDLQGIDLRLAEEVQDKEHLNEQLQILQKDLNQFKEASKRLSIEVTKTEARLYSKQQELQQLLERHANCRPNLDRDESHLMLELEAERRRSKRFEETADELRNDCQKLSQKLKVSESSLSKLNANLNKEQAKLVAEYEKKLSQIRGYQCAFDKSQMKYRIYGNKLRKYCEHLKKAHRHLCNPSLCGYMMVKNDSSKVVDKSKLALTPGLIEL